MKNILAIAILILSLSAFAENIVGENHLKMDCEAVLKTGDKALIAQRGCCSHHQGVCGCSSGRAQCCDGALSPSCTCNSIIPIEDAKIEGIKL